MILRVDKAKKEDVYQDIARIPEDYRCDENGNVIEEGKACEIAVETESTIIFVRGNNETKSPCIMLDEVTRKRLRINTGDKVDFKLMPIGIFRQLFWAWSASDPSYRVAARLAIISMFLGVFGFVVGILGFVIGIIALV
jgi:hypothetical protein